jgi:hypothetical protein
MVAVKIVACKKHIHRHSAISSREFKHKAAVRTQKHHSIAPLPSLYQNVLSIMPEKTKRRRKNSIVLRPQTQNYGYNTTFSTTQRDLLDNSSRFFIITATVYTLLCAGAACRISTRSKKRSQKTPEKKGKSP